MIQKKNKIFIYLLKNIKNKIGKSCKINIRFTLKKFNWNAYIFNNQKVYKILKMSCMPPDIQKRVKSMPGNDVYIKINFFNMKYSIYMIYLNYIEMYWL